MDNKVLEYMSKLLKKFTLKFESSSEDEILMMTILRNLAKFRGKHLCQRLFFNKVAGLCNFIKKETLSRMFSCEY